MKLPELTATETVIVVPGLQRPVTVMHVTDCHLTEADERDDEPVRQHAQKIRDYFAGRHFSTTKQHLSTFVDRINEPEIDAAVWTGDIIDVPSCANLDAVTEQFGRLNKPYLYTLGNHDWLHAHQEANDLTREANYGMFREWLQECPGFHVMPLGGVNLVALDNSNYQIEEKQWERLVNFMDNGEPWLLFMHIPLCMPALEREVVARFQAPILMGADNWTVEARRHWHVKEDTSYTRLFSERIREGKAGGLSGIFCGHVHFPYEEPFAKDRFQYITGPGFAGQYRLIRLMPAP